MLTKFQIEISKFGLVRAKSVGFFSQNTEKSSLRVDVRKNLFQIIVERKYAYFLVQIVFLRLSFMKNQISITFSPQILRYKGIIRWKRPFLLKYSCMLFYCWHLAFPYHSLGRIRYEVFHMLCPNFGTEFCNPVPFTLSEVWSIHACFLIVGTKIAENSQHLVFPYPSLYRIKSEVFMQAIVLLVRK